MGQFIEFRGRLGGGSTYVRLAGGGRRAVGLDPGPSLDKPDRDLADRGLTQPPPRRLDRSDLPLWRIGGRLLIGSDLGRTGAEQDLDDIVRRALDLPVAIGGELSADGGFNLGALRPAITANERISRR